MLTTDGDADVAAWAQPCGATGAVAALNLHGCHGSVFVFGLDEIQIVPVQSP